MKKTSKLFLASTLIIWFLGLSVASANFIVPILPPIWIPPVIPTTQSPTVSYESPAWWSYNPIPLFTTILPENTSTSTNAPAVVMVRKIVQIDLNSKEHNWPCKPPYLCDLVRSEERRVGKEC